LKSAIRSGLIYIRKYRPEILDEWIPGSMLRIAPE
jgi:hypothetical protein